MSFSEFIKNPAKFIWSSKDKQKNEFKPLEPISSTVEQPVTPKVENVPIASKTIVEVVKNDFVGFIDAVESKDWKWLLRGKTGIIIKFGIPIVIFLYILSIAITPKSSSIAPIQKPPVVDPGDTLLKPKFKTSNYLNGSLAENKFLVYSNTAHKINQFGIRGILLFEMDTNPEYPYYYALSKKSYLFFDKGKLQLSYYETVPVPNIYPPKTTQEQRVKTIAENVEDISDIKDLHNTYDGNFCFLHNNKFFVYNPKGEKVKEYEFKGTFISPSYYMGEIYYVREVKPSESLGTESSTTVSAITPNESKSSYYLIKLNKNDEEVYSQDLGTLRVQKISIVNDDRYLILIEKPSETTFYNIQMRDSGKRTIFNVTPVEKEVKITNANNLYFSSDDNAIFIQGNGVAKLFNLNGEQLWIN